MAGDPPAVAKVFAPPILELLGGKNECQTSCSDLCTEHHLWIDESGAALESHGLSCEPAGMVSLPVAGLLGVHGVQPPVGLLTQSLCGGGMVARERRLPGLPPQRKAGRRGPSRCDALVPGI